MYSLYEVDTIYGEPFFWFLADRRSIHEIATMYQHDQLSNNNIKSLGNNLLVRLINVNGYTIKPDESYHLFMEASPSTPGAMHIKLVFDKESYVNKIWRMPIESISPQTWNILFTGVSHFHQKEIDDEIEFGPEPSISYNSYTSDVESQSDVDCYSDVED